MFGNDLITYPIVFKENEGDRKLICSYYDAALQKEMNIESVILNEIDLHEFADKMKAIDWKERSQFQTSHDVNLADKETWKQ